MSELDAPPESHELFALVGGDEPIDGFIGGNRKKVRKSKKVRKGKGKKQRGGGGCGCSMSQF